MATVPTNVTLKLKEGQTRTIIATWDWVYIEDGKDVTDHYAVSWRYYDPKASKEWIIVANNEETDNNNKVYEFTAPDEAVKVCFIVRPVSKTYPDKNGNELKYFTAGFSPWEYHTFADKPQVPPVPTVTIKGTKLTIDVSGVAIYEEGSYADTERIRFGIVKVDANNTTIPIANSEKLTDWIRMYVSSRSSTQDVQAGETYRVRCQAVSSDNVESDWSEYSDAVVSPPSTPVINVISTLKETSVRLKWEKVNSATEYNIEWINKKDVEDKGLIIVESKDDMPSAYDARYMTLTELFVYSDIAKQNRTITVITGDDDDYIRADITVETGGSYYVRVVASNSSGASEGSEIQPKSLKSFICGTKPSAPTAWSDVSTVLIGEIVNLYWVHNSEDNSVLTDSYLAIEYTKPNSTVTTIKTCYIDSNEYMAEFDGMFLHVEAYDPDETTTRHCMIDTSDGVASGMELKWYVRTSGPLRDANDPTLPAYGDPSETRTIKLYDKPNLSMYLIGDTDPNPSIYQVTSFPFTVSMEVNESPMQTPISYHLMITNDEGYENVDDTGVTSYITPNTQVYSKYIDTTNMTNPNKVNVDITAGDADLIVNIPYTIRATVAMSSGLSDEHVISSFYVKWDDTVPSPSAKIEYNPNNITTTISPVIYDEMGSIVVNDNIEFAVYRREINGSFVLIGDGLAGNGSVTDIHPALDYARYRIVARSKISGMVNYTDLPSFYIGVKSVIIQWSETHQRLDTNDGSMYEEKPYVGSLLNLPYNISISDSYSTDSVLQEYIGRERPVSYYGTQKKHTSSWSTDIPKYDTETLYQIRRLAEWMGDVYVREPSGTGYWANITVSFSQQYRELVIPVSFSITRVDGGK